MTSSSGDNLCLAKISFPIFHRERDPWVVLQEQLDKLSDLCEKGMITHEFQHQKAILWSDAYLAAFQDREVDMPSSNITAAMEVAGKYIVQALSPQDRVRLKVTCLRMQKYFNEKWTENCSADTTKKSLSTFFNAEKIPAVSLYNRWNGLDHCLL